MRFFIWDQKDQHRGPNPYEQVLKEIHKCVKESVMIKSKSHESEHRVWSIHELTLWEFLTDSTDHEAIDKDVDDEEEETSYDTENIGSMDQFSFEFRGLEVDLY